MKQVNHIERLIESAREKASIRFPGLPVHKHITSVCSFFEENDTGNAARLVLRHGHKFRFVDGEKGGGFMVYDGRRWIGGEHGFVTLQDLAQNTAQHIRQEVDFLKPPKDADEDERKKAQSKMASRFRHAQKSGNKALIKGMMEMAKGAVKERLDAFDTPEKTADLLNVANGTVDLKTGKMKPHVPGDMITHITDLVFDPKAKAPVWDSFLWSIFEEDAERVQFFQRLIGYALHGHQEEENVVFILGNEKAEKTNGSNGKSRLMEGVRPIFGEYAWSVKTSLICKNAQRSDVNNDAADLFGKRIGIGSEFKDHEVIEEDAFKRATGADKINARHLYKNAFDFYSTATLFYTANKTPSIESQDNGVLRRPIFIQLNRVFYKASDYPDGIPEGGHTADLKLGRKLQAEKMGILAWAVRGAVAYNKEGLKTPPAMISDRRNRLEAFDPLQDWIDGCLEFDPAWRTTQGDLFESYKGFCELNATGDAKMTARAFGDKLTAKRMKSEKKSGQTWRMGVKLTQAGEQYAKRIAPQQIAKSQRVLSPV